jgi:flagellar protein FlaG
MLIEPVGIETRMPNTPGKAALPDARPALSAQHAATVDAEQLKEIVRAANRAIAPVASSIEFSLDTESGKTIVRVIDRDTQQLIRQIPTPEMLEISHALDRIQGLLLKQKA